jgi:hypothetical protein
MSLELIDLRTRRRRSLQRRAESETIYGRDHLRGRDLSRIKNYHRFLRPKTHICPTHAFQPFQGLLHPNGAGTSGHPLHLENSRRGRGKPAVCNNQ